MWAHWLRTELQHDVRCNPFCPSGDCRECVTTLLPTEEGVCNARCGVFVLSCCERAREFAAQVCSKFFWAKATCNGYKYCSGRSQLFPVSHMCVWTATPESTQMLANDTRIDELMQTLDNQSMLNRCGPKAVCTLCVDIVHACACICICIGMHMHACACMKCMHVHAYACISCMHLPAYYACACICMHIVHAHAYAYCACMCMHMHMHVHAYYTCMCMHNMWSKGALIRHDCGSVPSQATPPNVSSIARLGARRAADRRV